MPGHIVNRANMLVSLYLVVESLILVYLERPGSSSFSSNTVGIQQLIFFVAEMAEIEMLSTHTHQQLVEATSAFPGSRANKHALLTALQAPYGNS